MRLALASAAALLALAFVPAPAQAHLCDLDDPVCVAQCMAHAATGGDDCSVRALDPPGFSACPPGESGVVVTVGSRTVHGCAGAPTVTLGPCQPHEVGVIVYVNGNPATSCFSLA